MARRRGAIASLAVSIRARTNQFQKGLRKARRQVVTFAKSVKRAATGLVGFGAAVTAVAAGGGLAYMVKQGLKGVDAISKLADRIGDTTEAITGLGHAADITGAGSELLYKSLDVLSKRLGEAATGTGEAKDAIKLLGLNVDELIRMRPSEAFVEIAEAIRKLDTQAEKASVVSDLFSRAGLRLLNTLELGRRGLHRMGREAEKLGLTFSREQGAMVEAANDAVHRVKQVFVGIGRAIAIDLADEIENAAKRFTDWATAGEGLGKKMAGWFSDAIQTAKDLVAELKDVRKAVEGVVGELDISVDKAREWGERLKVVFNLPRFVLGQYQRAMSKMAELTGGMIGHEADWEGTLDEAARQVNAALDEIQRIQNKRRAERERRRRKPAGVGAGPGGGDFFALQDYLGGIIERARGAAAAAPGVTERALRALARISGVERAVRGGRPAQEPRQRAGETEAEWRARRRREVDALALWKEMREIMKQVEKNTGKQVSGAAYQ